MSQTLNFYNPTLKNDKAYQLLMDINPLNLLRSIKKVNVKNHRRNLERLQSFSNN